jgi:serine protease Do
LPRLVAETAPGAKATVKVLRDGKEKNLNLTITEMTEEKPAQVATGEGGEEESPLGLMVSNLTPELARRFRLRDNKGVVVVQVTPGSAGAEAGLRPGDLVLEISGHAMSNIKEFRGAVKKLKKGQVARLLIKRQGRTLYLTLEAP